MSLGTQSSERAKNGNKRVCLHLRLQVFLLSAILFFWFILCVLQ